MKNYDVSMDVSGEHDNITVRLSETERNHLHPARPMLLGTATRPAARPTSRPAEARGRSAVHSDAWRNLAHTSVWAERIHCLERGFALVLDASRRFEPVV